MVTRTAPTVVTFEHSTEAALVATLDIYVFLFTYINMRGTLLSFKLSYRYIIYHIYLFYREEGKEIAAAVAVIIKNYNHK
jgi:hypothetical protein